MRAIKILTGAMLCISTLSGCTGVLSGLKRDAGADTARADQLLKSSGNGDNHVHDNDGVVVSDGLWLSGNTVKLTEDHTLPPVFNEPSSFDRTVSSLQEFAERLTRLTGLRVEVSAGAVSAAARTSSEGSMLPTGATHSAGAGTPPLPQGMAGGQQREGAVAHAVPVQIRYRNGNLKGLLDTASERFGVSWKFSDGAIVFYFTDTRVFQVSAIPGDSKLAASVVSAASNNSSAGGGGTPGGSPGGSSTGGSGGGSSSSPSVNSNNTADIEENSTLSIFDSLQASIKAMLSPYGSVVPSPATGSIAVTDTPDVLERVAAFMTQQNRVMSRQILVSVTVLSVTLSASDNYGINWGLVYQALGTKFGILNTFPTAALNPVGFSASVITPSSRASGTTAMISALSQQGTVRRKTSASVTTLNNQPVPVQVATQQGYLAQVSITNTANVGSQTSLTAGTVTTGFNLTLLPHVLDDGLVMMQFYTNLSVLDSLQSISSGGQTIQVPQVDSRNFLQRVAVKSGQTLVISGYEGIADDGTQSGVGVAANPLAGGGLNASRSREVIVILITPVLMAGA